MGVWDLVDGMAVLSNNLLAFDSFPGISVTVSCARIFADSSAGTLQFS